MNLLAYHTTAIARQANFLAVADAWHRVVLVGALFLLTSLTHAGNYVVAWGDNTYGKTNVPASATNVIAVAAGSMQSLALLSDGTVAGWGYAPASTVPQGLSNVVAIAAGDGQNLALKNDGTLVAWGYSSGSTYAAKTNVPPGLSNIVAIACGDHHNLVLKADGTIYAWGGNYSGQTNIPPGLSNVVAIAAGNSGNLAIKSDGTVWGSREPKTIFSTITNAVAGAIVASGQNQGAVVMADGTAVAWGYLNTGGVTNIPGVTAVCGRSGFNQAGAVWALHRNGTLTGLGVSYLGGTNVYPNLSNVLMVAIGYNHHMVVVGDDFPVPHAPMSNPGLGTNHFSVQQPTVRGLSYRLEFKNSPADPIWQMLPPVPGDGTLKALLDPNPVSPQRIYRVRVAP